MLAQHLCGHARQSALLIAQLFILAFFTPPSTGATEQHGLAVLLRQIDQFEILAESIAKNPSDDESRYHFDHARLREDMQRMRQGIHDYLSPQRAQPRDPTPLSGDYRQETEVSP
ncbi:RAQPRD family integrative conjugative element protein [Pseudomonas asplenii]|uniref:integrative conjugative element protein, RAQPRD family n=1 Tax=Pseudomonas asplenii TaxID=53407 RepID=UPI0037CCBB32